MNNLKNKIIASVFSVLMIGSSCLSSTFAVPPRYGLPIGLKCDVSSNGPSGVAPVYSATSQPGEYKKIQDLLAVNVRKRCVDL